MADRHFVLRPPGKERRKDVPAHPAMQAADSIDRPAPADGQVGHVERFVRVIGVLASQRQQLAQRQAELVLGVPAQILFHQGRRKEVKSRGDRRVGRKEVSRACGRQRDGEGLPGLLHEASGALQQSEGGVPFVEMADIRLDPKCGEQSPAADPKHHLLLQAQFRVAAIKLAGDPPMHRNIAPRRSSRADRA